MVHAPRFIAQEWPTPTPLPTPSMVAPFDFSEAFQVQVQAEQYVQAWNTYIAASDVYTLIMIVLIILLVLFGIVSIRRHIASL